MGKSHTRYLKENKNKASNQENENPASPSSCLSTLTRAFSDQTNSSFFTAPTEPEESSEMYTDADTDPSILLSFSTNDLEQEINNHFCQESLEAMISYPQNYYTLFGPCSLNVDNFFDHLPKSNNL